ncbi:MAG: MFS transporter [Pseudomonadota bacterium]
MATIGGTGLWSSVVVLPVIQEEFGVNRGGASLPFTLTLAGFAFGGILMGRLADRVGIVIPVILGAVLLGAGYVLASYAQSYWQFLAIQCVLIGMLGSSVTFGPLVADITHWFVRRRGIAVAIVASGNYLAGALWPPVLQYGIDTVGWRQTHLLVGLFVVVTMIPLALLLIRKSSPRAHASAAHSQALHPSPAPLPVLQVLLITAGVACCVAMAMPQVHMVAYCVDLGYGAASGAELLSIMLGLGVVSRLISGLVADKIGGLATLLIGSSLQCLALVFYLPFDGLVSLYLVSALFGLSQGGIVPSYALVVRDYFPAEQAATRITTVLMATVLGMALGGWLSGVIYDLTGSYELAFINGIGWNLLNMSIAGWLLISRMRPRVQTAV